MDRLFVFHGADHKVGTTMLAQSVAETITAAYRDIKVLLVTLHGRPGNEYVDHVGESIENIRTYLESRVLSRRELLRACKQSENLYMLAGVENLLETREYFPSMAAYLLETVEEEFQIIIADSGNEIDNGLAMGGLQLAGESFLVLGQQETVLDRCQRLQPIYKKLGLNFGSFVINRYVEQDPYSTGYICERLRLPPGQVLKVAAAENERLAEMEKKTLLAYRNEHYAEDILQLSNRVLRQAAFPEIQKQRKNKWKSFI